MVQANAPAAGSHPPRLYCTFRLDGRLFGLDVLQVREVNGETSFTPIPHAPPEVRGCANLRGHIYLVLDLRQLLGMERTATGPESRLLICKDTVGEACGVLVDAVEDIVSVNADALEDWRPSEIEPSPAGWSDSDLIAGLARLPKELLVILDGRRFLPAVARVLQRDKPAEKTYAY